MKQNNKKGSSLLITVLVIAALMSIAFGLSKLAIGETKLSRDISKTLITYYAADSGAECQMYADRWPEEGVNCGHVHLSADIYFEATGEDGPSPFNRTITSDGFYGDIRRTVELTY
jgi:hypothetical protein